ncbi:MAG: redoxin domain-containing protein [Mariniblastus sp.]|nr:redoxin domain-containing protein [Mariniblastus sp.]
MNCLPSFLPHYMLLLVTFSSWMTSGLNGEDDLTIGSKAPSIDVAHWVSNGNGKFPVVREFEKGKVYVIEFWATWCDPCIASMPHISQLQDEFAERGVQIISVSEEDLPTVEEFLKKNVSGRDETFGQLTNNYCLTADPDGSVQKAYMQAARQNGIPTAFIVGKDGRIDWIGHPVEMDQPLAAVVDDQWDREKFANQFKVRQEIDAGMQQAMSLLREGKFRESLNLMDTMIEKAPDGSDIDSQVKMIRFSILISTNDPRSTEAFHQMIDENKEDPGLLNQLAWGIVEMKVAGDQVNKPLADAARRAIDLAVLQSPNDGAILDTQAHLALMQGKMDEAIQIQTRAVENAKPEIKAELERFLQDLKALKAERSQEKVEQDDG